jgi:DNA modification methylase
MGGLSRRKRWRNLTPKDYYSFLKAPMEGSMRKRYLDESAGPLLGNVWTDVSQLRGTDSERVGYPTQKPLRLLDRILEMSSNENDIVLDAFCGCGTALEAAQTLKRQWIGIDISPTACRVMAKRLRDQCKLREDKKTLAGGQGLPG